MSAPRFGIYPRMRSLKILTLLLTLAAALLLAGCTPKLEILSEGGWGEAFDDGRLRLSVQYIEDELFMVARNLTYEPIAIIWPEDSLMLPDGSRLSLGYLHKKALNQEATHELINLYLKQSGNQSIRLPVLPNESVSTASFVDFSPRTIKMLETEYYRLAAVKDPDDFAAPEKYPVNIDDKFIYLGPKLAGLKNGQQISWVFSYRLLTSGEEHSAELKVRVSK